MQAIPAIPLCGGGFGGSTTVHPSHKKPRYKSYPFSPPGIRSLTGFAHGEDNAASRDLNGGWAGKVTQPSGAPDNGVLLVWSSGPANDLNRPTSKPTCDAGLYLLQDSVPVDDHKQLIKIKDEPGYNEFQPRAVATYREIYGIDEPVNLPWLPNDGSEHASLPAGTPFGLVGTSSFYKRNTTPGKGSSRFDGLDPFNTSQNGASSNWGTQGADAGKYSNSDIYAVRLLAMEPTSHTSYGPVSNQKGFYNHANERLRILGEIPLRKLDGNGNPVLDPDGNPDTSFLAKIPADTPFTFQTLDKDGLALNISQTWHQVRPGEVRNNCGGCHAHSQQPTNFFETAASEPGYNLRDLFATTPLLTKDAEGEPAVAETTKRAVDVEYYRDIKPILNRSCVGCHTEKNGVTPAAQLVLDDTTMVNGHENTFNRLARDSDAKYGIKPVISNGKWRQTNASRYIRRFQSRRSLLAWKVFGRRLDGWSNADHPTETVPGDASTLPQGAKANDADIDYTGTIMPPPDSHAQYPPLTEDEKMTFARWIDLGCPIDSKDPKKESYGWFGDDLRPTLTISQPRAGTNPNALTQIRIGMLDYYSGLDRDTLSVKADFAVNGKAPGSELGALFTETGDHIWTLGLDQPIADLAEGELTVSVRDVAGNITKMVRTFSVGNGEPDPRTPPVISSFSASPLTVQAGGIATLRWSIVQGASTLTGLTLLPGVGDVLGKSSVIVIPNGTTTYTLTATNSDGSARSRVTVEVEAPPTPVPPTIRSFSGTPRTITAGESARLSWTIDQGSSHLSTVTITPGIGSVAGKSSVSVTPGETVTYTLTATSDAGSATAQTTIAVEPVDPPPPPPRSHVVMEVGHLSRVTQRWHTVRLKNQYRSPVIVATVVLRSTEAAPAVARIRDAGRKRFQIRLQNPGDKRRLRGRYDVHYVVLEEGVYTAAEHGVTMEAVRVHSEKTASFNDWVLEARTYQNRYEAPAVFGQVMTFEDPRWSVFWACGARRQEPPGPSEFAAGKHAGEDPDTSRLPETLGYIVLESGFTQFTEKSNMLSGISPGFVIGTGNHPDGTVASIHTPPMARIGMLSSAGMNERDGGWPVFLGHRPVLESNMRLAIDEDQLHDRERIHISEQVSYAAFGGSPTAADLIPLPADSASSTNDATFEQWQAWHFGQNAMHLSHPDGDADGDGVNNFLEFAFDTDPRDPGSRSNPEFTSSPHAGLVFHRPKSRNRLRYVVESSHDLLQWRTAPGDAFTVADNGFCETVHWRLIAPQAGSEPVYYRVRAIEKR